MVGSAVVRRLASEQCKILTADHAVVDLTSQADIAITFVFGFSEQTLPFFSVLFFHRKNHLSPPFFSLLFAHWRK
jgi:hypothetical protein